MAMLRHRLPWSRATSETDGRKRPRRRRAGHLLLPTVVALTGVACARTSQTSSGGFRDEHSVDGRATTGMGTSLDEATGNQTAGNRLSQWVDPALGGRGGSQAPTAGEDMALVYDPMQHRVLLFGGKDDQSTNINETWALDVAKNSWKKIEVSQAPPAVEDHSLVYDPVGYRVILYGGENGLTWNNTWSFDLQSHVWSDMTTPDAPRREDHTAVYDSRGKRMVVFGGQDNNVVNSDVWVLDLDPASSTFETWKQLAVTGDAPRARYDHVAAYDAAENRMVLFGGWDRVDKELLDDTWALRFDTSDWEHIKVKSRPSARRHAVSTLDTSRAWWILQGGFDANGYVNDVWAFDFAADGWLNITPGPQPRIDHAIVFDPQSGTMLLYGGDANLKGKFHDLWQLEIQPDLPLDVLLFQAGARFPRRDKPSRDEAP